MKNIINKNIRLLVTTTISLLLVFGTTTTASAWVYNNLDISYTVSSATSAPSATCSADQAITLPTSSATIIGNATDSDGTIVSSTWIFQTGPATPTVVTPNASAVPHTTNVTGMTISGIYTFTFTAYDNDGLSGSCTTHVYVDDASPMPDLIASDAWPTTATVNTSLIFHAVITNQGTDTTGLGFNNRFQISDAPAGAGTITNLSAVSMGALAVGASNTANAPSYTFTASGLYSVRVCADIPPANPGTISESNEDNNCGGWVTVSVSSSGGSVSVDLTADPMSVVYGNASLLQWVSVNADSCVGSNFGTGGLANGNVWVSPAVTTTYTITCSNTNSSAQDDVTVTVTGGPSYECSDGIDNADPEDTLKDFGQDPGCSSPTDDDETDGVSSYQCSDTLDNDDPEDTLADTLDPGCHTDGDAGNSASYNPNDDDERDRKKPTFIEF